MARDGPAVVRRKSDVGVNKNGDKSANAEPSPRPDRHHAQIPAFAAPPRESAIAASLRQRPSRVKVSLRSDAASRRSWRIGGIGGAGIAVKVEYFPGKLESLDSRTPAQEADSCRFRSLSGSRRPFADMPAGPCSHKAASALPEKAAQWSFSVGCLYCDFIAAIFTMGAKTAFRLILYSFAQLCPIKIIQLAKHYRSER